MSILFLYVFKQFKKKEVGGLTMFPRLSSNTWPQVIPLPPSLESAGMMGVSQCAWRGCEFLCLLALHRMVCYYLFIFIFLQLEDKLHESKHLSVFITTINPVHKTGIQYLLNACLVI